ncbi:FxSxx-COOH system tetratricopeptide repeat protein [Phytohabitans kaempferiae]|uniref:FxSxx-COOH system tetratricopeptide repeat protein n=1 Tax=Phytohabitans kaempferiae TaxID=1620943 RepID=A0ABV6M3S3_9ACTN
MAKSAGHPERPMRVFVSYAGSDRPWASWAAQVLEAAGYQVELDVWDWAAGDNFVRRMSEALDRADVVLSLWSPAYFMPDRFTEDEWTAAVALRPRGRTRLVPVRVAEVTPPGLLRPMIYRDVFGLDEDDARTVLLGAVAGPTGRGQPVAFPGRAVEGGPRMPGSIPTVWNVPYRNRVFTGRRPQLAALREGLTSGERALVQALTGIGGVGKTQLAIQYAHLFSGEYDLIWWVDAGNPALIGEQLARCAVAAGWVGATTKVDDAWTAMKDHLRRTGRWLLIFDNAEDAAAIYPWLPPGGGHVVITSRSATFTQVAVPVRVAEFTRDESIELLHAHRADLSRPDADELARALGDLPLAVAQAAALLEDTGLSARDYLDELEAHAGEILDEGRPLGYPLSLAAGIHLAVSRLGDQAPAALELLHLAAILAPEPIPVAWFSQARSHLPDPLGVAADRPLTLRRAVSRVGSVGLARTTPEALQVHRLTQAVLRDDRTREQLQGDHGFAAALIAAVEPDNAGTDPASWSAWATLLPHLLALDPVAGPGVLRDTALHALWYLLMRGDYQTALALTETWYARWSDDLGPDHPHTLHTARRLAAAYFFTGRYADARDLTVDTLARSRRVLGEDHTDTLVAASNLAAYLSAQGQFEEALDLNTDTLNRYRRVLGDDDPETLRTASNLAIAMRKLGRHQDACDLNTDTLARYRRALGDDHRDTLRTASNLAIDLRRLDRGREAHDLNVQTLSRYREVLGDDHPETLRTASNLALDLHATGRYQEAHDLNTDILSRYRRTLGDDHPETLRTASNLAEDLHSLGRYQEAHDLNAEILPRYRQALGADHPEAVRTAGNLAADRDALKPDQPADAGP